MTFAPLLSLFFFFLSLPLSLLFFSVGCFPFLILFSFSLLEKLPVSNQTEFRARAFLGVVTLVLVICMFILYKSKIDSWVKRKEWRKS